MSPSDYDGLVRTARRVLRNCRLCEPESLVHEAWIKVAASGAEASPGYVAIALHAAFVDMLRRATAGKRYGASVEMDESIACPQASIVTRVALTEAFERLPGKVAAVACDFLHVGKTAAVIAAERRIGQRTVDRYVSQARRELAESLDAA